MFIEQLSNEEKSLINAVRKYGTDSLGDFVQEDFVSCDSFLTYWEKAKAYKMSEVFKNQLILKKKVEIKVSEEELHEKMQKFISYSPILYLRERIFDMLAKNNDIYAKWQPNPSEYSWEWTSIEAELRFYMFNIDPLISNRYQGETLALNMPDNKVFKLVHGCKIMKAMGRLARAAGLEQQFEDFRIKQSQIMNESFLSANLCLSIHPLDYMTASWNENDWHSCMHWIDGEYRRGVIEMMNSPYVIVAYLESNSNHMEFYVDPEHPRERWNSKKWREFMIVNEYGIFGIKGYPYWNSELEDLALEWLAELFTTDQTKFSSKISKWRVGEAIEDETVNSRLSICMSCGPAMYNDFYSGNRYSAILVENCDEDVVFDYSGVSECVICGGEENFDESSDLACFDCVEHHVCCNCSDTIENSNELVIFNNREYCSYCYENLPECDICGRTIDLNYCEDEGDVEAIKFVIGETLYKKNDEGEVISTQTPIIRNEADNPVIKTICENCASKVFKKGVDEILSYHHNKYHSWWCSEYIVPFHRIKDFKPLKIEESSIQNFQNILKKIKILDDFS